jgi:hypothetical protein
MVNTYIKGNKAELEFRKIFRTIGYRDWKPSRARYNNNDLFGLFDGVLVAKKGAPIENLVHWGNVIFFQMKSTPSHFYKARGEIRKWEGEVYSDHVTLMVVLREGKDAYRIWTLRGGIELDETHTFKSDKHVQQL